MKRLLVSIVVGVILTTLFIVAFLIMFYPMPMLYWVPVVAYGSAAGYLMGSVIWTEWEIS